MLLPAVLVLARQASLQSRVEQIIHTLTTSELVSLCHGDDSMTTNALPAKSVPKYHFADGPHGVRVPDDVTATAFPTGVSMAATWNPDLIGRVGVALGEESLAKGAQVLLGPAVNIVRTPVGGRDFEYYSEDPFLAGRTAVGYILGLQSTGVQASVKHFAVNSFERERGTVNARVGERALREIYLPAFEAAVKEGKAGSVMCAYNKVNGTYCAENKHILTDILKKDWGFQGFVMSDWGAVHSTIPTATNGLDLEMPGSPDNFLGKPLLAALKDGKVPIWDIQDHARRFLTTMMGSESLRKAAHARRNTAAHQALAQEVAEQAIVLLKNDRQILPLDSSKVKEVAVIGSLAKFKECYAGGSSAVPPPFEVSPFEGIEKEFGHGHVHYYSAGTTNTGGEQPIPKDCLRSENGEAGLTGAYFANHDFKGSPAFTRQDATVDFNWNRQSPSPGFPRENFSVRWRGYLVPKLSGDYMIGTSSDDGSSITLDGKMIVDNLGEHGIESVYKTVHLEAGRRYKLEVTYEQSIGDAVMNLFWVPYAGLEQQRQAELAQAKNADAVIVVAGTDHQYDSEGSDKPDLHFRHDEDKLVEDVLRVRPDAVVLVMSGSPVEMPWINHAHAVLEAWYPGMMGGNAVARVLTGEVNPSGKLPVTFPIRLDDSPAHKLSDYPPKNGASDYSEDILVGYRWFDTHHQNVLFPFGYGLSYTNFQYSDLSVTGTAKPRARFTLTNTGKRAGSETAEAFVRGPVSPVFRAYQELRGFKKVYLKPGESRKVEIELPERYRMYYSEQQQEWEVEPGAFTVAVGGSSRDIRIVAPIPRS